MDKNSGGFLGMGSQVSGFSEKFKMWLKRFNERAKAWFEGFVSQPDEEDENDSVSKKFQNDPDPDPDPFPSQNQNSPAPGRNYVQDHVKYIASPEGKWFEAAPEKGKKFTVKDLDRILNQVQAQGWDTIYVYKRNGKTPDLKLAEALQNRAVQRQMKVHAASLKAQYNMPLKQLIKTNG